MGDEHEERPERPSYGFRAFVASIVLVIAGVGCGIAALDDSLTKGNNLSNQFGSISALMLALAGLANLVALILGIDERSSRGRVGLWFILNVVGTVCLAFGGWIVLNL